ncbi:MAG TPA: LysE family translocator [Dongiaceae bacterium]|nr:LysE family translocator [Dongiaceae bacterium]
MTDPLAFALAVAILLATPGPTNTLLLTAGAGSGRWSLPLILAEVTGYLVTILLVGYLVGGWFASQPLLAKALRIVVALYLAYLAFRLWRSGVAAEAEQRLVRFRDVFVTTMLNPKALLFALGIIPLQAANAAVYLGAFVVMVMLAGSGWMLLGAALAHGVLPPASRRIVPRLGAVVIVGFAFYLVLGPLLQSA